MPWSKINVSNCNRFFILHHINVSITFCGSGTFRSLVFSLLRAKVPTGNIRSLERKFPGTFIAWSKCSWEHSFRGAIYWGVGMLIEDRKIETRYKFEYSKSSFQTRNSISLFVFLRKPLHNRASRFCANGQTRRNGPACPLNRDAATKADGQFAICDERGGGSIHERS